MKVKETFNKDHSLQEHENKWKPTCRKYLEAKTPDFFSVSTMDFGNLGDRVTIIYENNLCNID